MKSCMTAGREADLIEGKNDEVDGGWIEVACFILVMFPESAEKVSLDPLDNE